MKKIITTVTFLLVSFESVYSSSRYIVVIEQNKCKEYKIRLKVKTDRSDSSKSLIILNRFKDKCAWILKYEKPVLKNYKGLLEPEGFISKEELSFDSNLKTQFYLTKSELTTVYILIDHCEPVFDGGVFYLVEIK